MPLHHITPGRILRVCEYCNNDFVMWKANLNPKTGRFCSHACFSAANIKPVSERFWAKVDFSDECWVWCGYRDPRGYGMLKWSTKKNKTAHRVAWELTNGPIPNGLDICHRCDNPACVRPDHLFLGTHTDNMRDMIAKGRHKTTRGEKHPCTHLSVDDVQTIRNMVASGATMTAVAKQFGIARTTVGSIVKRKTWRHVE